MAAFLQSDSRRAYSWWWDSHISPKNSKWLQENLTDMDVKVKTMIKLIEEDADSFARRAEMYYKKRPELMKLVEEFYRAYRALAERYDHATGALRQAHRTMSEAFPNQIPYTLTDDSPTASSVGDVEPQTPEMPHPIRALFDPDDLQKDALGLSSNFHAIKRNGAYSEENDPAMSKKGLKQLNEMFLSGEGMAHVKFAEGKVRKGLHFQEEEGRGSENTHPVSRDHQKHEVDEKDDEKRRDEVSHLSTENQNLKKQIMSESERASIAETEVQHLQQALSKLQDEKEAALLQYQRCLERISNMEKTSKSLQDEVFKLSTENQNLTMQIVSESQRAGNAETEVQSLQQALSKLQVEKEAALQQYQQCLERISNMETKISSAEEDAKKLNNENQNLRTQVTSELERAGKAETEVQSLQQALSKLQDEKEAVLLQYQQCSERISNVETEISRAVEDVKRLNTENQSLKMQVLSESDRVGKAETEVQSLQQALSKVQDEKEAVLLQYQQCLEKISNVETEISHAEEIAKRLNSEIQMGAAKLNSAEARCVVLERENQSLRLEVDALVQKTMLLQEKLMEKHEELETLSICIQEERMHSMQAEEAILSLQNLHSKSQEDQRVLASELQHGVQILREMEFRKQELEDEVQRFKEENNGLSKQSLASAVLLKNLQDDIVVLREMKGKLEEEVGLRVDQRNALQQELYCLKEEINDLDRQHRDVIEQVESVGLNAQCLRSSIKDLQDENVKLKEICKTDEDERIILLAKLENMEMLLEKNTLLENSLSDANAELEGLREKLKTLEESIQSLHGEKSALVSEKDMLVSQVESILQNMEKLSEKSTFLEISVSDANAELNGLRGKSKSLEESFDSLHSEKSVLIDERNALVSQVGSISQSLENLEKKYAELEVKHSCLETEQQSALHLVDELQVSLELQKREHSSFVETNKTHLAALQNQIDLLLEEGRWRKKEFEEEQDKVVNAQVEIFILQRCIQDMKERNLALSLECQKHVEASMNSEKHISELEQVNIAEHVKVKSLLEHQEKLGMLIFQVLKSLHIDMGNGYSDKIEDQVLLQHILGKIEDMQSCILDAQDEKQQLLFEISVHITLLDQLRLELSGLKSEKNTLELESEIRTRDLSVLQSEKHELLVMNEQMKQDVQAGDQREVEIKAEMEILRRLLSELQEAQQKLQNENGKLLDEKQSLAKEFCHMREEKCLLEEENNVVLGEVMTLGNLSLIFESYGTEKAMEIKAINDNLEHFRGANNDLEKKVTVMSEMMQTIESENSHLRKSVEKMEEHRSRSMLLEDDLNTARHVSEQLNHQIEFGKNLLGQKEMELLLALQKVEVIQVEKTELHRDLGGLKKEYDDTKMTNEDLEKQIFKLSKANTHQNQEIEYLHEANDKLESELCTVQKEIEALRIRQEHLNSDMQNRIKEAELCEAEAATLYNDLQISAVRAALFDEKVCELIRVCENLEEGSMIQRKISDDESASRIADIEELKNNLSILEGKNGDLKAELTAYLLLILSLKDSVTSLEDHTLSLAKIHETNNQQIVQDGASLSDQCNISDQEPSEDGSSLLPTGLLELQKLQTKVQAVEKAVMEIEKLVMQERFNLNVKLEAATKEVEDLKSKGSSSREEVQTSRDIDITLEEEHTESSKDVEQHKNEAEINKVKSGLMMKDIQLDHVSDSSSYENGVVSYGKSRRENAEADDQMLELWETAEQFYSRVPTANKMKKLTSSATEDDIECHQIDAVEEQKSEYPSSELHAEKELAVDKLEVRNKVSDSNQGHKRVIERLASDARRLSNLQTNIQELKKRIGNSDSSDLPASKEYDTVKGQLKEVEEAILQLVDVNGKLKKDAEGGSTPSDGKVTELEEMGKMRKRQVSERARRGSEKIGWLELEVQKIQFLLLKLEDEYHSKGTKAVERRRVLLRDYLYGRKERQKRKKVPFCACVRPSTKA